MDESRVREIVREMMQGRTSGGNCACLGSDRLHEYGHGPCIIKSTPDRCPTCGCGHKRREPTCIFPVGEHCPDCFHSPMMKPPSPGGAPFGPAATGSGGSDSSACRQARGNGPEASPPPAEPKCRDCGTSINDGEAKCFGVCDACWDEVHPPPSPPAGDEGRVRWTTAAEASYRICKNGTLVAGAATPEMAREIVRALNEVEGLRAQLASRPKPDAGAREKLVKTLNDAIRIYDAAAAGGMVDYNAAIAEHFNTRHLSSINEVVRRIVNAALHIEEAKR